MLDARVRTCRHGDPFPRRGPSPALNAERKPEMPSLHRRFLKPKNPKPKPYTLYPKLKRQIRERGPRPSPEFTLKVTALSEQTGADLVLEEEQMRDSVSVCVCVCVCE